MFTDKVIYYNFSVYKSNVCDVFYAALSFVLPGYKTTMLSDANMKYNVLLFSWWGLPCETDPKS